jgi:anti-sigma factor (TIGR02949 family)
MITCDDAVRRLWELVDGSAGAADREAIEEHLRFCRRCCGEAEFATELRRFLAAQEAVDIPTDVHERLLCTLDDLEARA